MTAEWSERGRGGRAVRTEQVVELLRTSPIFAGLPTESLRELADLARHERVAASTSVVVDGSVGDAIYVIHTGRFAVEIGGRAVHELAVADHFGEVAWLYGTPRTASVRALTDGELLVLSGDGFSAFLTRHPTARSAIAVEASTRYAASFDDDT